MTAAETDPGAPALLAGPADHDRLAVQALRRCPMPAALLARPFDLRRGLPVPAANTLPAELERPWSGSAPECWEQTENLQTDFSVLFAPSVLALAEQRRCGLCAEKLGYWAAFLGGQRSAAARRYVDPPMHEQCAEAATRLCPHLAVDRMRRRESNTGASVPEGWSEDKPAQWVMVIVRSWQLQKHPSGIVFLLPPAKRSRLFVYVGGRLVERA